MQMLDTCVPSTTVAFGRHTNRRLLPMLDPHMNVRSVRLTEGFFSAKTLGSFFKTNLASLDCILAEGVRNAPAICFVLTAHFLRAYRWACVPDKKCKCLLVGPLNRVDFENDLNKVRSRRHRRPRCQQHWHAAADVPNTHTWRLVWQIGRVEVAQGWRFRQTGPNFCAKFKSALTVELSPSSFSSSPSLRPLKSASVRMRVLLWFGPVTLDYGMLGVF